MTLDPKWPLTPAERELRDELAIRLYVQMHGNPETTYTEDAEDALSAAHAFIKVRREWQTTTTL